MNARIVWHMMPGDSEKFIRKSLDIRPDAIIPCLEDGVAYDPVAKQNARELLARLSSEIDWAGNEILFYPRINRSNSEYWRDDVVELMKGQCDGFVIAKEESPDRVRDVDEFISEQEERVGRTLGSTRLIVMIETALGLRRTYDIASASDRVDGLLLGREDLSYSLGIMRRLREIVESRHEELLYARSKFVADSKAAGKEAIDGAPFTFEDEGYMLQDSALAARLGFTGKLSAHPKHAHYIREGFAPEPGDVEIAREMLAKADEYRTQGAAPVFAVAGMEVTPPIVEQARLVVARAEAAQKKALVRS
jgi:citrate lyase subunit beta/citryl-CoA lyase